MTGVVDHPCDGPLQPQRARDLVRAAIRSGVVAFSDHALDEMAADNLETPDCVNVLRAGVVDQPEFERGSWRYRVWTQAITVVVAFRSTDEVVVVTAWRNRP
ncbi:MAG: DUF4258 domain-containing protein [Acidobacteriota bacterium]